MALAAGARLGPYAIHSAIGAGVVRASSQVDRKYSVARDGRFLLNTAVGDSSAPITVR